MHVSEHNRPGQLTAWREEEEVQQDNTGRLNGIVAKNTVGIHPRCGGNDLLMHAWQGLCRSGTCMHVRLIIQRIVPNCSAHSKV